MKLVPVFVILLMATRVHLMTPTPKPDPNYYTEPDLGEPDDDEVLVVRLAPHAFKESHGVSGEDKLLLYQHSGFLTPDGQPSNQFSVCTWFKVKKFTGLDYILSIQPPTEKDGDIEEDEFYFLNIAVSMRKLAIHSRFCMLNIDKILLMKQWYHSCIIINRTITVYIDGEEMTTGNDCHFNGTEFMTSKTSSMTLGSHSYEGITFNGYLADLRLYARALSSEEVSAIRNFTYKSNDYVSGISRNRTNLPKTVEEIKIIDKSSLAIVNAVNTWMYIPDLIEFEKAKKSCMTYGGLMLSKMEATNVDIMRRYLSHLGKFFIEIWLQEGENCIKASITPVNIIYETAQCDEIYNFVCSVPVSTKFKLLGIPPFQPHTLTLFNPHKLVFVSGNLFRLIFKNQMMYLLDDDTEHELLVLKATVSAGNMMGRKYKWVSSDGDTVMTLTVTSCRPDQFTCDKGLCVDIYKVCDFHAQCEDSSDEENCNSTETRPKYYDKALSGVDLLEVGVIVNLNSIIDVDMEKRIMEISLYMSVSWRDQRVTFHNLHSGVSKYISPAEADFMWRPNILIDNVIHSDIHKFSLSDSTDIPILLKPDAEGTPTIYKDREVLENYGEDVVVRANFSNKLTISCDMDLFVYPFDAQTCYFEIFLRGRMKDDVWWDPATVKISHNKDILMQLYQFDGFNGYLINTSTTNNKVHFEVHFSRKYGSQVLVTFLPCVVLQVIGMSVFAIPLDDLSDRLTVSISTLIVMAALFTQMSSTLPVSADPKMIDGWMFTHVFMLAVVFILQLFLNVVHQNQEADLEQLKAERKIQGWTSKFPEANRKPEQFSVKLNKICVFICVILYSLFVVGYIIFCFMN